jgi:arylsulfatase A-like enzyme
MCDQLRADYLSCTGHPHIDTPNIDALARQGVVFTSAFCQAPVCGPSRASFYTGRYARSHGASYNNYPLRVDEKTLGDYLGQMGLRTAVVGKTHMKPDLKGMARMGIDPKSALGEHIAQAGFEDFDRDDGVHPGTGANIETRYNHYLRSQGYTMAPNPWHGYANCAESEDGERLSGWRMRHANLPARVSKEHSESAYTTDRGMAFIRDAGDDPWCLHLSYIKPHWPYMAPSPYHSIYQREHVLPANRTKQERLDPHPVFDAYMHLKEGLAFSQEACRERVIPTYMGLIKEIDDNLGRMFDFLEKTGRMDDTLIVFTSDHGDYLGDHWMGDKEYYHEESVRIPLIIVDPSEKADGARGTQCDKLVESIDLIPTFIDLLGGQVPRHTLEGRTLKPFLHSKLYSGWRDAVFSEMDYGAREVRTLLGLGAHEAHSIMVRTQEWKYIYFPQFRPQLFDLKNDPNELVDLGNDSGYTRQVTEVHSLLTNWLLGLKNRLTITDGEVEARTGKDFDRGVWVGVW